MKFKLPKFNFKSSDIIKIDTLVGKRAVITGDVNGKGNFKIDGTIDGDVKIKGDLVTGEKSVITGDIVAKNIIIAGTVVGNVEASGQLTIKHTGTITGDQKCGSLIVEEGSKVTGKCEIAGTVEEVKIPDIKMDDIEETPEFSNFDDVEEGENFSFKETEE